jgi:hypothetical protein
LTSELTFVVAAPEGNAGDDLASMASEYDDEARLWPPSPALPAGPEATPNTILQVRYGLGVSRQYDWIGGHLYPIEDEAGNLMTLETFVNEVADYVVDVILWQNGLITDDECHALREGRAVPRRSTPFPSKLPAPGDPEEAG